MLKSLDDSLAQRFADGENTDTLVYARASAIDQFLRRLWRSIEHPARERVALVAVGGYGRGELHPHSDIDVLLLLASPDDAGDWLSGFLAELWDCGLDIGQSVRTISECAELAEADLSVITSLIESRLIDGPSDLLDEAIRSVSTENMWNSKRFFEAKRTEQRQRHGRYDDTGYKLEPNVKGGPGGLRDIQMIGWVANRHFGSSALKELVGHKFLTRGQLKLLIDGRSFLWRVRYALHLLTGRSENRLLFDHQKQLASLLGYEDASYTLAVEQLMQRYYRTVRDLSRLNEMLLQLFEEAILLDPNAKPTPLNERFVVRNGFLQTKNDQVFADDPSALLEVFLLLQQHPELRGVSALTIGLMKRNLHLIDDEFRNTPRNHRLFLQILRAPEGVTHELRRMNLYGVLGLYIPAFGRIVGRMQYDLFHAYTVDEHTLFVVSNLRRFALQRFNNELPHVSEVMQSIERQDLAYLGGLFHDIGKGRGGDHSKLGAVDAEAFCLEHGLDSRDADLVAWLVRHHLLLSMTAQKKDLGDPTVIQKFAAIVDSQERLDHLYVLTVADVRGTNPKLWNSWKASLFQELYTLTSRALHRGLDDPAHKPELIAEAKASARQNLIDTGLSDEAIAKVWELFPDEYFLRYRTEEAELHTQCLLENGTDTAHLNVTDTENGFAIFLFTPRRYHSFAHTTAILDELGLDIQDARIVPANNGFSLDNYMVESLDASDSERPQIAIDLNKRLSRVVARASNPASAWQPRVTRPLSRRARMFSIDTRIRFTQDSDAAHTILELTTADRPGLLSTVGEVFVDLHIDISIAKIVTIGEKAEDVFYLTDLEGLPLAPNACKILESKLTERLMPSETDQ